MCDNYKSFYNLRQKDCYTLLILYNTCAIYLTLYIVSTHE